MRFLIQNGGYVRKAFEAWFTVLIEALWGKHVGSWKSISTSPKRASAPMASMPRQNAISDTTHRHLSVTEAARIAAILPLAKASAALSIRMGFTRRYGNTIARRSGVVRNDGLDACLR